MRRSGTPGGLARDAAVQPGLAANTALHHREYQVEGLILGDPLDFRRPQRHRVTEGVTKTGAVERQPSLPPIAKIARRSQGQFPRPFAVLSGRADQIKGAVRPVRDRRITDGYRGLNGLNGLNGLKPCRSTAFRQY